MKTEKEIRDMLEMYQKDLERIKAEYNKYIFTMYEERYLQDICDAWTAVESKIMALKWVLREL